MNFWHTNFWHNGPGGWGYGPGDHGWWVGMMLFMVLFWVVVVVGVLFSLRHFRHDHHHHHAGGPRWRAGGPVGDGRAEDILRQRFAAGEIDEAEFRARLALLREGDDR